MSQVLAPFAGIYEQLVAAVGPEYFWALDSICAAGGHPRVMVEAFKLFGIHESAGPGDNPEIIGWANDCGLGAVYVHDETPWCGLFAEVVTKRAGYAGAPSPLWALQWAKFGEAVGPANGGPSFGDVLVFTRPGGGHVGFYIGEDDSCFHVLGGNESDQVEICRILKTRLYAARRCPYAVPPANVKPVKLAADGAVSTNES